MSSSSPSGPLVGLACGTRLLIARRQQPPYKSRGFGYVQFKDFGSVAKAIALQNKACHSWRTVTVPGHAMRARLRAKTRQDKSPRFLPSCLLA